LSTYVLLIKAPKTNSQDLLDYGSEGIAGQASALAALGVSVERTYFVTSSWDLVMIAEVPDEVSSLALGLSLNAVGLYAEVLRAFDTEDLETAREKLGAALPQRAERGGSGVGGKETEALDAPVEPT
jgi:uncharacterized protein with GYD domain